ncbi:hypothetical protein QO002_005762 [Pararhizobium capsulatum DSM 1112]|uniref:Uncharacterized protein n=1 Tax=Pararhizobium capsulatum DSM 1112 TaxID=1121113 RepID=A0ABU0C0Z8_9HYPH|nr:hypothetical protein [Pararhizobium capsulatum DSM 1112]
MIVAPFLYGFGTLLFVAMPYLENEWKHASWTLPRLAVLALCILWPALIFAFVVAIAVEKENSNPGTIPRRMNS